MSAVTFIGKPMRVLVIEDDEELAQTIAAGLRQARIAVDIALDGETGLSRALVQDYEVIVLDRDLPVVHGDEVCARLLDAGGRSRVLMLTGAAETEDLIEGLGLGADDYLAKPFDFPVLVARIGALARRAQPSIPPVLKHDDIVLDTATRRAYRAGTGDRSRIPVEGRRIHRQRPRVRVWPLVDFDLCQWWG